LPDEERAWLGWRARQAIETSYTVRAMQQATLDVYAEVLTEAVANPPLAAYASP
jgi:hypothetical protein